MGDQICGYKHYLFHWQGRKGNEVTLISDSIGKWIRYRAHLEVQAIPGMHLREAFTKMCLMEIKCWGMSGAILHCGTNDFAEGASPELIVERTAAIINFMQHTHRSVRLAVGIILPRICDEDDDDGGIAKEERRVTTNLLLKKMCKEKHVLFANFKNAAYTNITVKRAWYANDRLHLNKKGIEVLGDYYQGIAASLMDPN
jgi:hypothetical protein